MEPAATTAVAAAVVAAAAAALALASGAPHGAAKPVPASTCCCPTRPSLSSRTCCPPPRHRCRRRRHRRRRRRRRRLRRLLLLVRAAAAVALLAPTAATPGTTCSRPPAMTSTCHGTCAPAAIRRDGALLLFLGLPCSVRSPVPCCRSVVRNETRPACLARLPLALLLLLLLLLLQVRRWGSDACPRSHTHARILRRTLVPPSLLVAVVVVVISRSIYGAAFLIPLFIASLLFMIAIYDHNLYFLQDDKFTSHVRTCCVHVYLVHMHAVL